MKKNIIYAILTCFLVSFFLYACSKEEIDKNNNEKKANYTILCENYAELLCEDLVNNFNANSKSKVNFETLVSNDIKDKISNNKDYLIIGYGDYSKEKYNRTIIAKDGIAIIVNKKNKVNNLNLEILNKIYSGEITNWEELGYKNADIVLAFFDDNVNMEFKSQILNKNKDDNPDTKILLLNKDDVNKAIIQNDNYIGILPSMYVSSAVKELKINGISLNSNNIASGLYPLNIPIYINYNNDSEKDLNDFIKFIQSDNGKSIIDKYCIQVKN